MIIRILITYDITIVVICINTKIVLFEYHSPNRLSTYVYIIINTVCIYLILENSCKKLLPSFAKRKHSRYSGPVNFFVPSCSVIGWGSWGSGPLLVEQGQVWRQAGFIEVARFYLFFVLTFIR